VCGRDSTGDGNETGIQLTSRRNCRSTSERLRSTTSVSHDDWSADDDVTRTGLASM